MFTGLNQPVSPTADIFNVTWGEADTRSCKNKTLPDLLVKTADIFDNSADNLHVNIPTHSCGHVCALEAQNHLLSLYAPQCFSVSLMCNTCGMSRLSCLSCFHALSTAPWGQIKLSELKPNLFRAQNHKHLPQRALPSVFQLSKKKDPAGEPQMRDPSPRDRRTCCRVDIEHPH